MKAFLTLLIFTLVFTSCTVSYKSGQTPDDVYFSPERPVEEYVRIEKDNDRQYRNQRQYRSEEEMYDDRYVRMRLRNRMWSVLDDDWYAYNPYSRYHNSYYSFNSGWNRHNLWNYYYNPYGTGFYIATNPGTATYNRPRNYNLFVFDGGNTNPANPNLPKGNRSNTTYRDNTENYRGSGGNAGTFLRDAFGNSGNYQKPSSSNSSSSSSSNSGSSSSSSGSSSSSSGNAPVRKF